MYINRRQFIKSGALATSSLLLPSLSGKVMSAGYKVTASPRLVVGSFNNLCVFDTITWKLIQYIPLPFSPHAYVPLPDNPNVGWVSQRYNFNERLEEIRGHYLSMAALINIEKGEILKIIPAAKDTTFRGHGVIRDGAVFLTRVDEVSGNGHLTGYDVMDGKQIADYKISEAGAHDVILAKDGTALVISMGVKDSEPFGKQRKFVTVTKGAVIKLDLESGKVLSRITIDEENQHLSHMDLYGEGNIIAATAAYENPLIYSANLNDKKLHLIPYNETVPVKGNGRLFSVIADHHKNIAVIADHASSRIIFVDLTNRTLIGSVPFYAPPWGVALDAVSNNYIITGSNIVGLINRDSRTIKSYSLTNTNCVI